MELVRGMQRGKKNRDVMDMKKNFSTTNRGLLFLFFTAALITATSCDRADMYGFATGKHPLVYALTDTDDLAYTKIIKANDEGFYRERDTSISSGFANLMDVDKNGTVYLYNATDTYIVHEDGNEISATSPISISASASSHEGTFIFTTLSKDVYRFNMGAGSWDLYKTLSVTYNPYNISVDVDEDIIFFNCSYGGSNIDIYDLKSETLQLALLLGPGTSYFERKYGSFYNGKTGSTTIYKNDVNIAYLASPAANAYAISDDGEVFASENDGHLAIYRMTGGTSTVAYTFSSTSGTLIIRGMKKGKLAVGINGSDASEDGLYVYHYNKDKMEKLSSRPIYLIYVR